MRQHRAWRHQVRSADGQSFAEVICRLIVDENQSIRVEHSVQSVVRSNGPKVSAHCASSVQVTSYE